MKKTYRWKYSIRQVVAISIAALLFVSVAMSLSFLNYSLTLSSETKKELYKYRMEVMLTQTENSLDEALSLTQKLGRDIEVQKFFENSFRSDNSRVINLCDEMKNTDSNIENIIMINKNKLVYNCYSYESYVDDLINIHDPNGKQKAVGGELKGDCYSIPYRCLLPKNTDNLLACGRCISVDHVAHASTRIQGTCMLTGQAVGTAAAIALKTGITVGDIDVKNLRAELENDGVFLLPFNS